MGQVTRKFEGYEHAVKWLCDAGYAWAHHVDDRGAEGVVLSPKGPEVLGAKPRLLLQRKPIGKLIVKAVKGGAKEALQKAVIGAAGAGKAGLLTVEYGRIRILDRDELRAFEG